VAREGDTGTPKKKVLLLNSPFSTLNPQNSTLSPQNSTLPPSRAYTGTPKKKVTTHSLPRSLTHTLSLAHSLPRTHSRAPAHTRHVLAQAGKQEGGEEGGEQKPGLFKKLFGAFGGDKQVDSSSSLLLSHVMQKSMSLEYEPATEPLHIPVK